MNLRVSNFPLKHRFEMNIETYVTLAPGKNADVA